MSCAVDLTVGWGSRFKQKPASPLKLLKLWLKCEHPTHIKFDPVLGHEHRPAVDGCEKNTSLSYPSTTQAPNHKNITITFVFLDYTAVFRCASRSPKQHPVGLGELIPERKFQLFKRGAIIQVSFACYSSSNELPRLFKVIGRRIIFEQWLMQLLCIGKEQH